MKKLIILVIFSLTMVFVNSCKKDDNSVNGNSYSLTGKWEGSTIYIGSSKFELKLTLLDIGGIITGTGTLSTEILDNKVDIPLVVTGSFSSLQVNLKFNTLDSFIYTGIYSTSNNNITGNLNYSSYTGVQIVLKKDS